jgi:hypothetical protein
MILATSSASGTKQISSLVFREKKDELLKLLEYTWG